MARRRSTSNPRYWAERDAMKRMELAHEEASSTMQRIAYGHNRALELVQKDIDDLFGRFGEMSREEAESLLYSYVDDQSYDDLMEIYRSANNPEVRNAARDAINREGLKYRIHRKEAMRLAIEKNMMRLADGDITLMEQGLLQAGKSELARLNNDIHLQYGKTWPPVETISDSRLLEMVRAPWSGKSFSERVWSNTMALGTEMNKVIPSGMLAGKSSIQIAKDLEHLTEYGKYGAERLVRTETTYVIAEADKASAKSRGIKKMEFSAVLDAKTSDRCKHMDGAIIDIDKLSPGTNQPPLHPHCRSVLLEVNPDWDALKQDASSTTNNRPNQLGVNRSESPQGLTSMEHEMKEAFRKKVLSGKQKLTIDKQKQYSHQPRRRTKKGKWSNTWKKVSRDRMNAGGSPNSILYGNVDPSALVKQYAGNGDYQLTDNPNNLTEYNTADHWVGRVYNRATNRFERTKRFAIYYTKGGTHVYPVLDRK